MANWFIIKYTGNYLEQWACDHLGHTKAVHLNHYRQLSGYLERVQIAKLMIVHDMKLTGELKGNLGGNKELNGIVHITVALSSIDVLDIRNNRNHILI